MSISKLRETFEKKGCQVILVIIGILTAIGFLSTGQCSWLGARRANEPGETPIAKIGDVSIGERQYRAALESLRQNNQMPNVSPMMTARMQAAALQQLVESAYLLEMAKRMGVKTDDESLMKAVEENFDEQVKLYRQMMIAQNQLKPDATEEEFQAAVKKSQGADVSTLRERMVDQAKEALKDPAKRPMVVAQTLQPRLVQAYEAKVSVTPEVLKSQFDEISYQTVAITAPDGNWAKAKENAQKALDEIAAGAKFEDIHKKYGTGKIPTEVRPRSFFEGQKNFDAVAKAKPGEVVMVMVGAQPYLYRVEKITPKPPADFEQKKADYEKGYRQSQAYQLFQKDLESLKETKPPKWLMPGHEVLYEVAQAADDQELQTDLAKKRERMQELMEKAKQAEGDGMSEEAATLARFWAFSEYYGLLSPKEQEEQSDLKAEVLQRLLQFTENTDLRVELYDLYASENDWESAQEQLRLAWLFGHRRLCHG